MRLDQMVLSVWIAILEDSTLTDIRDGHDISAANFHLYQNYPNPFNPSTTISFSLETAGEVSLKVYDIKNLELFIRSDWYEIFPNCIICQVYLLQLNPR